MPLVSLVTVTLVISLLAAVAQEDNIDEETVHTLCGAQCLAKCTDERTVPSACNCSTFRCNATNNPGHVALLPLNLTQVNPHSASISWSALTPHTRTTIVFVLQIKLANETAWVTTNQTTTSVVHPVNPCVATLLRVAAVDRHGRSHFSNVTIPAGISPSLIPGPPTNVRPAYTQYFHENNFYTGFLWDLPDGWDAQEIAKYNIPSQLGKRCNTWSRIPPVPILSHRKYYNGSGEATFKVHETGYECYYTSKIEAETVCGVRGEAHNIMVDLRYCGAIEGFPCPEPPQVPPSDVRNASVVILTDRNISLLWAPPENLGSTGRVDTYLVKWGELITGIGTDIRQETEQRRRVDGNTRHMTIQLGSYNVTYGFKVLAQAQVEDSSGDLIPPDDQLTRVIANVCISKQDLNTQTPVTNDGTAEQPPPPVWSPVGVAVGGAVGGTIGLTAIVVGLLLWRRLQDSKRRPSWTSGSNLSRQLHYNVRDKLDKNKLVDNPLYVDKQGQRPLDSWEVPRSSLTFLEVLGQGAFGQVVRGKLIISGSQASAKHYTQMYESSPGPLEIIVAVKLLIDGTNASQQEEFLREMAIMKGLGRHPHVVSMIACCTLDTPLCLVVEHMANGDLLHYLRRHRHLIQESEDHCPEEERVTLADLLSFARQIAVGMEFLSSKSFVHRDLATRNVLVGEMKCVKIGDFGLARYVYDDQVYVTKRCGKLPLKWMAPESIFDLTFTTASDVWSFGVVLFELLTLGGMPYPTINNRDLLRELQDGYRMPCPDNCSPEMYQLMRRCWFTHPAERPSFSDLRALLDGMLEEHTRDNYLTLQVDDTKDYYHLAGSTSTDPCDLDVRRRAQSSTLERRSRCSDELVLTATQLGTDTAGRKRTPTRNCRGPTRAAIRRSKSAAADLLRASITSQDPLLGSAASTEEEPYPDDLNETEL